MPLSSFRSLRDGDVLCVDLDADAGTAVLSVNETEFRQTFNIPATEDCRFVIGSTLCNDHVLTIVSAPPVSVRRKDFRFSLTPARRSNTVELEQPLAVQRLSAVLDVLQTVLYDGISNSLLNSDLIPLCERRSAKLVTLRPRGQDSAVVRVPGALGYQVELIDQTSLPKSHIFRVTGNYENDFASQQSWSPSTLEFRSICLTIDRTDVDSDPAPAPEDLFLCVPRTGDIVARGRGWTGDREDGGAGGLGDVVGVQQLDAVAGVTVDVAWRAGGSSGPTKPYSWRPSAAGEVTVFALGYNHRSPPLAWGSTATLSIANEFGATLGTGDGDSSGGGKEGQEPSLVCRVTPVLDRHAVIFLLIYLVHHSASFLTARRATLY